MATKEVDFGMGNTAGDDMFDIDLLDSIDAGTTEVFDQAYKTVQWTNGDPKYKSKKDMNGQGGFFFPAKTAFDKEVMLAHGWSEETLVHNSNEETQGYYRRELTIIPITLREAWAVKVGSETVGLVGFDNSERYTNYAAFRKAKSDGYNRAKELGIPTTRLQILALIVGLEDEGPIALTLGGSVARAFYDDRGDTVLGDQFKAVISVANKKWDDNVRLAADKAGSEAEKRDILKKLGKKWPMRAFRLNVGANRDEAGNTRYTTVGKSPNTSDVTLPIALGLPGKGEEVDLNQWFVGKSQLATMNELFDDAKATWAVAWDNLVPADEGAATKSEPVAQVNHAAVNKMGL